MEILDTQVVGSSRTNLGPGIAANSPPIPIPPQTARCAVCDESTPHFIRAQCGHDYCILCICKLFEHVTKNEDLVPAQCCGKDISLDVIAPYLPIFSRDNLEEHGTLDYAQSNPSDAATLSDGQSETIECPGCNTHDCLSCQEEAHRTCEVDDKETIEYCREQGWQRCPGCGRIIELTHGCYRMTCLCRTEFCYLCGVNWKNCACPNSEEERAMENADDPLDIIQNITWAELEEFEQYMIDFLTSEEGTAQMRRISELSPVPTGTGWESFRM